MDSGSAATRELSERPRAVASTGAGAWFVVVRRYFVFVAVVMAIWEVAQLPLYTIWSDGTIGEIAFAVTHCTAGDMVIAGATLLGALLFVGNASWPAERYRLVATVAVAAGLAYTVFSEWLNTEIRGSWAYEEIMPTLPVVGAGLSPLAQWVVIPIAGFWWARRPLD